MKAKLNDGFEIELRNEVFDDWEYLEVLTDIDEGETGLVVKAARKLLGKDGVKMLKEHLRDENGKVSGTAMVVAIQELMESVKEVKN